MRTRTSTGRRMRLTLAAGWCLGMTVLLAQPPNLLKNGSFEQEPGARGLLPEWKGPADRLQLVPSPVASGAQALRIEKGGSVSQTVPAEPGRSYVVTVQADTVLYEEEGQYRYRSRAILELAFLQWCLLVE